MSNLYYIEKITKSIQSGYSVIHIYQKEVWDDSYDWKKVLNETIEQLQNEKSPMVIFISCDEKYSFHIQKLDSSVKYKTIQCQNLKL